MAEPLSMPFHRLFKRQREPRVAFHALYRIGGEARRVLLELRGDYIFLWGQKAAAAVQSSTDFRIVRNDLADFAKLPELRGVAERIPLRFFGLRAIRFQI